jgi:predicted dehydrogenase
MSEKIWKVGLMSCGAVANYGHIPSIIKTPGLELHAIYDPNRETLDRVQKEFDIPNAFDNEEDFFSSGIEAVSITSPAPCHKNNVIDAAKHKMPVICEKPLSMDEQESIEMINAMKAANQSLYTAFCYRFSPSALKIKELVEQNSIGSVRSLRLIFNWGMHKKYGVDDEGNKIIQKRREGRMLEGGPMVDCGTHQIDLAKFWLGSEVKDYKGHGAWVDDYEAPDHVWLHMNHENGAHTVVEMSYSYHHTSLATHSEFVYELIGTKGVIRYDRAKKTFTMENEEGTHNFDYDYEKSFTGLYAEWNNALNSGTSDLLTSAEDGMRVVEIARNATNMAIENR